MHDAGAVRCGETGQDRLEDVGRLLGGEHPVILQQFAEGDAGEVLHHQVGRLGVLPLVEDVDDVRVRQACRRAGLLDEPLFEVLVVGEVAVHDLDGDGPFEPQVGGEVDRRHAAAGDA